MKHAALALLLLLAPAPVTATGKIVVVKSAEAPVIEELTAGFKSAFPGAPVKPVLLTDPASEAGLAAKLEGATAILTVGPRAATAVARAKPSAPTIACVPPAQADPKTHGPTLRLQPPADGVIAAVAWLGSYKRVAFIAEASATERVELAKVAGLSRGLKVQAVTVTNAREIAGLVTELASKNDIVVVDVSEGLTTTDVQFLLRTTDQAKVPLVGTSEGFAKAGAPVAVAIDPRNVGAEAGRLAGARASGMSDPRRFRVMVNLAVAGRLGMNVRQDKGIVTGNSMVIDTDAAELDTEATQPVAFATASKPTVLKRGRLQFPPLAMARQAEVVLEVQVTAAGTVGAATVVKGDPLFANAAIESVKTWEFKPATSGGKPVDGTLRLNLKFQK